MLQISMGFGAQIRGIRLEAGITLREMATLLGIKYSRLASWEWYDKEPEPILQEHFLKVANGALGIKKASKKTK